MALNGIQSRLYIGYDNGQIRYIDLTGSSAAEVPFNNLASAVQSLSSAGNLLLAQGSNGYGNGFIINSSGVITGNGGYYYGYSHETAWDAGTSACIISARHQSERPALRRVDQSTGQVGATGETPYHGDYNSSRRSAYPQRSIHPARHGDIYSQAGLTRAGALGRG